MTVSNQRLSSIQDLKVVEDGVEHLGIPHWFVLDACLVLAGGKGFLSSTPDPSGKISTSVNDFLTGIEYWFFLDDATDYTICTDFSDWEPLPREDVPERWLAIDKVKTLNTGRNDAIMESSFNKSGNHLIYIDKFCALSGFDRELRAVHLIPQACAPWCIVQRSSIYKYYTFRLPFTFGKVRLIDDVRQLVTLESGLHDCMNRPSFVIVPFCGKFVVFFFTPWGIGLAEPYHLRTMTLPPRIEGYALFARFAWAITSIAKTMWPTHEPKRKQESDRSASPSGQPPPRQRRRGEAGSHDENAESLRDSNADRNDDGLQNERGLTPSQLKIFRDAEEGIKPFPEYMYDGMNYYPGISRTEEMKRRYLEDHPTISATGEATARGD
ncbi:hypothetical protein ARMGADRAFT_1023258 [Armillaria gallica]|uniref:HNH nuclease domain-containing protein n=1 Tax=Armillaria gallica TaxID=47427 RepID=A0A2H3E687_ARMGA|nr:hypothetical protein ARMGADRAFT_1023258 [Armillaria gallica]